MVNWHQDKLETVFASASETMVEVLPRMEAAALQVMLVVDERRCLEGIITDGDIRRALLRGQGLAVPAGEVMQPRPKALPVDCSLEEARQLMLKHNIRHIPLIDEGGRVVDLLLWLDVFETRKEERQERVVIMAGGKGSRLDPFTKILPKPMIPLGDKPMVEVIMDKFHQQGFSRFIISLGYKGEIVRLYFNENNGRPYEIDFVQESQPLGTAGSLALLAARVEATFIVTNCDIIVEADYGHLLEYHREKGNDLTVVGALRDFTIPYGVLRTEEQELQAIDEKPSFHFLVNTGLYVLEPGVLPVVEGARVVDMTDLIMLAKEQGLRVGVYPHHGKWFDVGQWEEYRQTLRQFDLLG